MREKFCVKKKTLLLIAGIVWLMAGINVARLGVVSYMLIERKWYLYVLSVIVFAMFGTMFYKMSKKHTKRILSYETDRPFWHFLDKKAYILMACMMGGGVGCALAPAGVTFTRNFICYHQLIEKEMEV